LALIEVKKRGRGNFSGDHRYTRGKKGKIKEISKIKLETALFKE